MADLMAQVLDRLQLPRYLELQETAEGFHATWRRKYACGEISDQRQVDGSSREGVLQAILDWEAGSDQEDAAEADRCLTCFPIQAEPGKEGA